MWCRYNSIPLQTTSDHVSNSLHTHFFIHRSTNWSSFFPNQLPKITIVLDFTPILLINEWLPSHTASNRTIEVCHGRKTAKIVNITLNVFQTYAFNCYIYSTWLNSLVISGSTKTEPQQSLKMMAVERLNHPFAY